MVNFECPRCEYNTDQKTHMVNHIERKKMCKATKIDISLEEYREQILDKTFSKIYKIMEENKILKERIKKLENDLVKSTCTGNNNVINSNNIILNIQLTPYNDPKLENVEKYYKEAIKKVFLSVPTLIERIHFNEKLPENKNILISNFRTKVGKVFNGKKWETIDEDKLITELIDVNERALEEFANDNPEHKTYINIT